MERQEHEKSGNFRPLHVHDALCLKLFEKSLVSDFKLFLSLRPKSVS